MFHKLPSLTSIRAFESAARLLSFKAAADELNVSPTAISHQIRGLESHLKVTLFERKTRAIELTKEGRQLALSSHELMKGLLNTVNELTAQPNELTIGTTNAFAAMWLVPHLEHFRNQHADIEVAIRAEDGLIDIENDHRVDMVIRSGHHGKTQQNTTLLYRESLGFFATSDYWQKLKEMSRAIFYTTRWKNPSLASPDILTAIKTQYPHSSSFEIRVFDDENQTIQAALSGQGIAIASQMLVKVPIEHGWLFQDKSFPTLHGLDHYCVLPTRNHSNHAALQMISWLLASFEDS